LATTTIKLEIISLARPVFKGRVASITVPGQEGELTILPKHIPLMTSLKAGEIIIRGDNGKEDYVAISSGVMVIDPKKITILVDSADMLEELDEKKIQEAKERAEKLLTEKKFADDVAFADATALLEKSLAQLKVLRRKKGRR
jgi:F-type H+-transporting ATPase subunit epsilon